MLAVSHRSSAPLPLIDHGVMDESGTIDPSTLNASASTISPNLLTQPNPRGTKRSRSPDGQRDAHGTEGVAENGKASKRSRQVKSGESPASATNTMPVASPLHSSLTPQTKAQSLPQSSPNQTSPQRSTPGSNAKASVVKALPTVRDHTTDQLGPEGDEYIPRETDSDGETKVSKDGYPLDNRKYKCRTFQVPNRGEKLFMLATECARVLGYRDSYLLFNKNRSLFKIIASQQEKDNLIHQEILPYSYRSRQIAIVTARSMFRQFGSRLIEGGRRVRDDYWETKARKQGFTEEDAAGEKRPGAAKAREAAAAEASQTNTVTSLPQGEIIYSNGPGVEGQPPTMLPVPLAPLPMIHLPSEDLRPNNFGSSTVRPRQEITGPPYQDRTQSSNANEILTQASQAAEFNKQLGQTRTHRAKYLDDYWRRPHEQPVTQAQPGESELGTVAPQDLQSPPALSNLSLPRGPPDQMSHPGAQMLPQAYTSYSQPNPMASPVQPLHRPMTQSSMHQSSPSMGMGSALGHRQAPSYNYSSNQMWQGTQPHPSPLSQTHHLQYGAQQQQPSPQSQQQQQQQHQQQPPPPQQAQHHHQSHMPPPQMPQQPSLNYGQMTAMGGGQAYSGMTRGMYHAGASPQQQQQQQQYAMAPQQSNAGPQPGMPGWPAPGSAGGMSQDWPRY